MLKGCGGMSEVQLCMHAPTGAYADTTARNSERDRTTDDFYLNFTAPKILHIAYFVF